ncbi:MAG: enoyl-CoA hydratase/isomerase family protein, partial [Candidatus Omnitrophica bacterium]|nr:enoyl-CoA hydratase/isomerase family protein [Candidatus Omnitrophota bacterium]
MPLTLRENKNIAFIEFDQEDSKVNVLSGDVIKQLDKILDELKGKTNLEAVVFASKKPGVFIAGADIKEIENITDPLDGTRKAQAGQNLFNKIEDLKVPTVALITGVALGGGCELALACQYRLATFNPKVSIGLPEVNLGFVPGFGGTYRLPRIVGLQESLKMILTGRPVNSEKALKIGLVDRVVTEVGLEYSLEEFVADIKKKKIHPDKYKRRRVKGLQKVLEESLFIQLFMTSQAKKGVLEQSKGFYPAPLKAIEVIKKNYYEKRAKGLLIESQAFGELAVTDISKNLVKVFYLMEKYKKLSVSGAENIKPQKIDKCAVLGAGVMGGGIAQLLSSKDIWTRIKDINLDAIAKGFQAAGKIYHQGVQKRKFKPSEAQRKMAHITGTLDYSGFQNADMVIEAVVEKMEVKKKVFKELSEVTNQNTILATNTSALSVAEMAKDVKDPSKVIGLHFFNPVHRMPLVEIITTEKTSKETIVSTLNLVKRLGKTPILVKDSCGFIVNRILLIYINEGGRIFEETGELERVDEVMTKFGMPMGPFLLSDEVGLDVGIKVLKILENGFGERFKPVSIFDKVFAKGLLGKKSRKGYYVHEKRRYPNP